MRRLAVIAERLAVIAGDDNDGRPRRRAYWVDERRECAIGSCHFAEVRLGGVLDVERRSWPIRGVRLVEMDPCEPAATTPADPLDRALDDNGSGPFRQQELRAAA